MDRKAKPSQSLLEKVTNYTGSGKLHTASVAEEGAILILVAGDGISVMGTVIGCVAAMLIVENTKNAQLRESKSMVSQVIT